MLDERGDGRLDVLVVLGADGGRRVAVQRNHQPGFRRHGDLLAEDSPG